MFRKILSIAVLSCLLSLSVYAKNIQQTNLTAVIECNNCKNKIEKTLKNTNGVKKVNVDMKNQSVKVEYDNDVVSETQLVDALNNADAKFGAKSTTCTANKESKNCTAKEVKSSCNHDHKDHKNCSHKEAKSCNKPCEKDGEGCQKKCNK